MLIVYFSEYTNISSRELDYSYDDSEEGTSLQIDKFRIQQDAISDLVSQLFCHVVHIFFFFSRQLLFSLPRRSPGRSIVLPSALAAEVLAKGLTLKFFM